MSETFSWQSPDIVIPKVEAPALRIEEYLQEKEALCNSTKSQLKELKSECNIEKKAEKKSDLDEILQKTIDEVISNYLKSINSKEWINLSREWIYKDVIKVIDWLEKDLAKNNIFKKDIDLIKSNFLLPKDKWIALIDFAIKEKFSNKEKQAVQINNENIDSYYSVLESFFATLYDVSKTKTPEELHNYLQEFKKNPKVKEVFEKIPDLEKIIFQVWPSFLNSSSKEVFLSSIHTFLSSIKWDIIQFSQFFNWDDNISQEKFEDSKLNILNNSARFLSSLLNEESVDNFSKNVANLELVAKNPVISEILDIINRPEFPKSDKLLLSQKILEWVEIFSSKEINDTKINEYINSLIWLISSLSKNIPNKNLISLINKMKWTDWESADIDISLKDLWDFLWKNKSDILAIWSEVIKKWYDWENISLNKVILELLKNDTISSNLNSLWKQFVENLRKITKIDLTKYALEFRKKMLEYNFDSSEVSSEKTDELSKLEANLIDWFWWKLEKSVVDLIKTKLESKDNNKLNKQEIIKVVLNDLKLFLQENTPLVFDYAKELWFKVDWFSDKQNIVNLIKKVLENPKLVNIISKVIENLWQNLKWKSNIVKELDILIKESIDNNWEKLLDGTGDEIKKMWIETIYDEVLWNKEYITTILNIFWKDYEIVKSIDSQSITQVSVIFKKYISKDQLTQIMDNVDIRNPLNNIKSIWIDTYNTIENKTGFINELLDTWIIQKVQNLSNMWEKININPNDINIWIDLLYNTLNSSKWNDLWITLNKILDNIWLSNFTNISILWKSIGENLVSFLKSVDKEDLKKYLSKNIDTFTKLYTWNISPEQANTYLSWLSIDLSKIVDMKKFQKEYSWIKLDDNQRIVLDLSDEFQEVMNEKSQLIKSLVSKWKDIYDIYNGKLDINRINPESIKDYGKELFDLLHSVVSKIDNKYIESNIKVSEQTENKVVDTFISSFMWENKWFIVKQWISWVFGWFDFNVWASLDIYFRDTDANRDNFWATLLSFLENKK